MPTFGADLPIEGLRAVIERAAETSPTRTAY
jgi:hypothetical protein